ncbi:MAG TPA: ABC transporter ATP-binding protein [Polyangia bacterium]|jgi:ABC-type nitrate/sulfonate/bicarbonate transport system ATPase subunit|nr:ABC transporter ATP-binding protein [Polyangia bacterium]
MSPLAPTSLPQDPTAPVLRLTGVRHAFGATEVLHDISLTVAPGSFVALVGPSGCGKTTLLHLLSGHDPPTAGTVEHRGTSRMVYQHDGLFPWLTVEENIAFGLRQIPDPSTRAARLVEMLRLIRLAGFERHYPHQLSGGMRQRVELARALAGETELLLMDEPFSSLDDLTRRHLRRELALMLRERPCTVVLVTHDIEEAVELADRVIVLSERPARVQYELAVDLERPRSPTHPTVVQAVDEVLRALGLGRGGA